MRRDRTPRQESPPSDGPRVPAGAAGHAFSEMLTVLRPFSSRLSHALRNPLSGILMNVQMLAEEFPEHSPLQGYLSDLLEGAKMIEDTIQLFLEFTSPSPLQPRSFSIQEPVAEVVRWVQQRPGFPPVTIQVSCAPRLHAVHADPNHVRKMLRHLLDNATDAMPAGGEIRVRCGPGSTTGKAGSETPGVELEVADSGPGISETHFPRVFEPFFTTRAKKMGLGLSIVNLLCDLNHGTVALTSEEGKGTRVRIRLPAAPPAGGDAGDPPEDGPCNS